MNYVTDSHSLIWYLTEDKRLGNEALSIFTKADRGETTIIVPTIVLAEIIYICEKKKATNLEIKQVLNKIKSSLNYLPYNLDMEILEKLVPLQAIPEIHDGILVTTAKLLNATLITKDKEIVKSNIVQTLW